MPESTPSISRRRFLERLGRWGTLGAAATFAACGADARTVSASCDDVSGLTEQERRTRESLQYVDASPIENKVCDNCEFWVATEPNTTCGSCQLVKGPIHPSGYCTSWVPQRVEA